MVWVLPLLNCLCLGNYCDAYLDPNRRLPYRDIQIRWGSQMKDMQDFLLCWIENDRNVLMYEGLFSLFFDTPNFVEEAPWSNG